VAVTAGCSPSAVASGGDAICSAGFSDTRNHDVSSWRWDDGGAGGSFLPSPEVHEPTYTAPQNRSDVDLPVTLTATATCDGPESMEGSGLAVLMIRPVDHALTVAMECDPALLASGGTTECTAVLIDTRDHDAASWSWSDDGAGGVFSPSSSVRTPTYTAPHNTTESDIAVHLTVSAICGGPEPLQAQASAALTVAPIEHAVAVAAECRPEAVSSGGTTECTAAAADSRGHAIAAWQWDDGGAGGAFAPGPAAQDPTYSAPDNISDEDITIQLTATATCEGPEPLSGASSVGVTVAPVAHVLEVAAAPPSPAVVLSGGEVALSAETTDSRLHGVESWLWSDGGAGGAFSPSAWVPTPAYIAPRNTTGADVELSLTVSVTCDGPGPLTATDTVQVTVHPTEMFGDVRPAHWAFAEIEACFHAGIVGGYDDGLYHPELAVTRDQMAAYIARALASGDENVPTGPAEASFPDVPNATGGSAAHWAFRYVEYAVAHKVVAGYDDGLYHPDREVQRDQMAVYVARSLADPTGDEGVVLYAPPAEPTFPDVTEGSWAFPHVEYCVARGVVQGYEDGLYHPSDVVTRDQMAVYVARAFELLQ
jgi:hypothetical protein